MVAWNEEVIEMADTPDKRVIGFAIKLRIIMQMQQAGFSDLNDYIDYLNAKIKDLQAQVDSLMKR